MRNRFNIALNELPDDIHDTIICIQAMTNLKFDKAEDWTAQNQGWVLKFKGNLYKYEEQTYDTIVHSLKFMFMKKDPMYYTLEQAIFLYGEKEATAFEHLRVNCQCDGYDIFISQW